MNTATPLHSPSWASSPMRLSVEPVMHKAPTGTVLAFDFGEARIGVAQGDAELGLSHPLATVTGNSNDEKFNAIAKLIRGMAAPSIWSSDLRPTPTARNTS